MRRRVRTLTHTVAALMALTAPAHAVDGISVTIHWSGTNDNLYGGYGSVWRHDIRDTRVVSHQKLFAGPARMAKISPDGTRVAFIKKSGMVAFMSLDGGAVTDLVQSHGEAALDWPKGDWIYYTLGGFEQPSGSKILRRVNARTQVDEAVVSWNSGTWFFSISSDLKRAAVRPDDSEPEPYGRIVAYDMVGGGGTLRPDRATDRWSCGTGMDPQGVYFMDGWQGAHEGLDMRRWDDLTIVKSFSHADARGWTGPNQGEDWGSGHNRNNYSANSQKWIAVHLGWGTRGSLGANQVLYNWVDEQRIVVTSNTNGSQAFDSSGGFWVGSAGPAPTAPSIGSQPTDQTVREGQRATFSVSASGSAPLSYQWQRDGQDIDGASSASYTTPVLALKDSAATFRCVVSNAQGSATSRNAKLIVEPIPAQNSAPVVSAGEDGAVARGVTLLLTGSASDDGLPNGSLSLLWSRVSGPDAVTLAAPTTARSQVTFGQTGVYVLRLTADDGALTAHDDVRITVTEPHSVTLLSPDGGEVWQAGTTQLIEWRAVGVTDVSIDYSTDDGATWISITETVDDESPDWQALPWVVPDTPSTRCRILISAYVAGMGGDQSAASFEIRGADVQPGADAGMLGLDAGGVDPGDVMPNPLDPASSSGGHATAPNLSLQGGCSLFGSTGVTIPGALLWGLLLGLGSRRRRRRHKRATE